MFTFEVASNTLLVLHVRGFPTWKIRESEVVVALPAHHEHGQDSTGVSALFYRDSVTKILDLGTPADIVRAVRTLLKRRNRYFHETAGNDIAPCLSHVLYSLTI